MGELSLAGFGPIGDIIWQRPEWLKALWLLIPVLWLRLLRRPAPILRVPLLGLWDRAERRSPERFGGLLRWLGIVLDLVLVAGAVLLAAGPTREHPAPPRGDTVIVVDASAAARLRDLSGASLYERSRARASELAAEAAAHGRVSLLWARLGALELGAVPGDLGAWKEALREAPEPGGARPESDALKTLLRRLRGSGRVHWVGAFAPPGEFPSDERLGLHRIEAPQTGAGLGGVRRLAPPTASPNAHRLQVRVFGEGPPRELRWTVAGRVLAKRAVRPTAEGALVALGSNAPAALRAGQLELAPPDAWPEDDRHAVIGGQPRRVALRFADATPAPPPPLRRWLEASDRIAHVLSPEDSDPPGQGVLQLHLADAPERSLGAGAHLVLGARRAGLGLRFGAQRSGPFELEVVRPESPLLAGIQPAEWLVSSAFEAYPEDQSGTPPVELLRSGDALLMARSERPDRRVVWWGMGPSTADGSWPLMPIFPLMLDEAAAWAARLAPLGPQSRRHFDPGEVLALEAGETPRLLALAGSEWSLERDAEGRYRVPERPGRHAILGGREIAVGGAGLRGAPSEGFLSRPAAPRPPRSRQEALEAHLAGLLLFLVLARIFLALAMELREGAGTPLRQRGIQANA